MKHVEGIDGIQRLLTQYTSVYLQGQNGSGMGNGMSRNLRYDRDLGCDVPVEHVNVTCAPPRAGSRTSATTPTLDSTTSSSSKSSSRKVRLSDRVLAIDSEIVTKNLLQPSQATDSALSVIYHEISVETLEESPSQRLTSLAILPVYAMHAEIPS